MMKNVFADQNIIAGISILAFSIFVLVAYVFRAERKDKFRNPDEMDGW